MTSFVYCVLENLQCAPRIRANPDPGELAALLSEGQYRGQAQKVAWEGHRVCAGGDVCLDLGVPSPLPAVSGS